MMAARLDLTTFALRYSLHQPASTDFQPTYWFPAAAVSVCCMSQQVERLAFVWWKKMVVDGNGPRSDL